MSLHLWSWIAVGLQFILTILFGAIAQTRLGHPLRKVLFGLAIVLLAHTIVSYFVAHQAKPFVIHGQNAELPWAIYSFVFGFLSWTAFCGSWLLSGCRLENHRLVLERQSLVNRFLDFEDRHLEGTNICRLTWNSAAMVYIFLLAIFVICLVYLIGGLIVFVVTGSRPLSGLADFIESLSGESTEGGWPLDPITIKNVRIIPILLPFYPIWGLAKGIVWLLGLIPKCLPIRKPLEPLELHLFTAMQPAESTAMGTTDLRFTPAQPSWFKRHLFRPISRHLLRPASQSLRWLGQLLVAVKRGACPRIELEDS